ncbi:MAG: metallophosphoesterase [Lishizhenia sp.]
MKSILFALTLGFLAFLEFAFYTSLDLLLVHPILVKTLSITVSLFTVIALIIFFYSFRKQNTIKYKFPFRMMGLVILLIVPKIYISLFYLLFIAFNLFDVLLLSLIYIGFTLAIFQVFGILYGIFIGKYKFTVRTVNLTFDNLPSNLNGLKLVQISDLHLGSFSNRYHKVEKAIQKINALNADYVVFTGDLVNNYADEVKGWEKTLSSIISKKGVYSILGNHDYGDYVGWKEKQNYENNLSKLINYHKTIGFKLLRNEAIELSNCENKAFLIGVENWGAPPFKQYGDLTKAMENVEEKSFKILLSHDPSHFDYEVTQKTNIDLTLSGHTHGMQFGFERWGIKVSPVQLKYPKWAGLYNLKNQYLYVNRGLGYIGFPGRVGIYPEITEIILTTNKTESQN